MSLSLRRAISDSMTVMRPLRPDLHHSHKIAVTPREGPFAVVRRVISPLASGVRLHTSAPSQQQPRQYHCHSEYLIKSITYMLLGRLLKVLDP